ncbi:DapH/DapD/GlmU-related protein [Pseudomonas sp. P1B16]|jgi:Acetyltransferase (isoleucine patch superfamily)|uniref:DapH/DapD/GlmU-related protein n=2 Tax=Pseudomonas TaxID=286 RepID=UPI001EE30488|nr:MULTISPECIES: DapH/DapD/GlmU-related protein [Pseudomonas]UVL01567.1 sugar O-acetyltransferase [Pseudomonas sp. B21-047]WPM28969.1 DapH/DapD/GlmU-related protein [Pseudomonas sp. P1B16]
MGRQSDLKQPSPHWVYRLFLFIAKLKRSLTPRQLMRLLDTHDLGKKQTNRLMAKAGIRTEGSVVIRPPIYFERGNLELGKGAFINSGCVLLDEATIRIGRKAMLGPQVRLCTTSHDVHPDRRKSNDYIAPITVGDNAWIGAGAVILPGVNIGQNSVVAANSVVTEDVVANALYAGSPAKFKKWLVEPDAV